MPRNAPIPAPVHHRRSGQARLRIEGRDFYLGPFGTEEAEENYRRIVAEWLSSGVLPEPIGQRREPALFTINQLVLAYWKHAEVWYQKDGRPTRELSILKTPLKVVRQLYGSTPAAEFGPLRLKAVREQFIQMGHCRYTINKNVGRLRRMFAWGVENEIVPAAVDHGLRAVAGLRRGRTEAPERDPVGPVEESVINATLPHLSRQLTDMVRLQLLTGCRPGEICIIRPCDVNRDGDVWEYTPESHKTQHHGRDRRIFIGPKAQAILAPYLDDRPADTYCFRPVEVIEEQRAERTANRKTPLSCGNRPGTNKKRRPSRTPGECYDNCSYRHAIHRACKDAGIAKWSPNRLRHSRATDLRRRFGIEGAQTVLGHAELSVTQVYAERDFAAARKIMAEVG